MGGRASPKRLLMLSLLSSRDALGYDAVTSDAPSRVSVRAVFVVPVITASGNGAFLLVGSRRLTSGPTIFRSFRAINLD